MAKHNAIKSIEKVMVIVIKFESRTSIRMAHCIVTLYIPYKYVYLKIHGLLCLQNSDICYSIKYTYIRNQYQSAWSDNCGSDFTRVRP